MQEVLRLTGEGVEVEDQNWNQRCSRPTPYHGLGMKKNDAATKIFMSVVPETYAVGDCGCVADIGTPCIPRSTAPLKSD
jgi:hypothetical protein